MRFGFYSLIVAAMALLTASAIVYACSVPVFRYALERWQPDMFQALVLYKGELSEEQKKSLEAFDRSEGKDQANVELVMVDLADSPPPELLSLLEQQKETSLPRILLMPPPFGGAATPLWSGALEDKTALATFNNIVDSPVRREIFKRLLAGDSAIWLLIESGKKELDDPAFAIVEEQLKKFQKEMKLPEQDPKDLEDPSSQVRFEKLPVRIAFSTIRISRSTPEEKGLISQLMQTEDDLLEESDKPMVFPVFGRGRALWAYIGAGINEENLAEAAQFLIGPCSCEIKNQNPGTDLLMAADWEGSLEGLIETKDVELPPLSGLEGFTGETPEIQGGDSEGTAAELSLVPKPAAPEAEEKVASTEAEKSPASSSGQDPAAAAEAEGEGGSLVQNMVILGIVGFALLAGMTVLMRKKQ